MPAEVVELPYRRDLEDAEQHACAQQKDEGYSSESATSLIHAISIIAVLAELWAIRKLCFRQHFVQMLITLLFPG